MVIFHSYVKLPEGILGMTGIINQNCDWDVMIMLAKLVNITPITMVYAWYIYSYYS